MVSWHDTTLQPICNCFWLFAGHNFSGFLEVEATQWSRNRQENRGKKIMPWGGC